MRARAIVALAALVLLTSVSCRERTCTQNDLDLGIWYWHTPYRLTDNDAKQLRELGIGRVYVRAATFGLKNAKVIAQLPQDFQSGTEGLPLVLVFNGTAALAGRLDQLPLRDAAHAMAEVIAETRARAETASAQVVGVQLDVDVPTRLVPTYARLLVALRKELPKGTELSATALTTWLGSDRIDALVESVDFLVPQFYEGRTPKSVNDPKPISDPAELARGLERIGRLGGAFRIGLPTYGHALLFDPNGKLQRTYRGLSVDEAMRHPALVPEAFFGMNGKGGPAARPGDYIGEDLVRFRAREPGRGGRGLGYAITYILPTPEMLVQPMRTLRESHPANLKGAILYRFPEPGESMTLPLSSLARALRGEPSTADLRARLNREGRDVGVDDFRLELKNEGAAGTFPGETPVFVLAVFDGPGLEEVQPGDFTNGAVGIWNEAMGELIPSGPMRANAVLFKAPRLAAGQTLRSGLISFGSKSTVSSARLRWMARGPGGFESIRGEQPVEFSVRGAMQ